ncbi:MAG: aminotransferase class I/II-fold pyridoxal phosphate-dependent enzyme, partial [Clostridiales bacterium]|nr:aminotransferase class I/II-fold pyridoxal phosphate-dependent enzyme [Clostridiales bacterium]
MDNKFWSGRINCLTPYVPGEQPKDGVNYIKINTNENPYGPSPKVFEAISKANDNRLRLYPDPGNLEVRTAFSARYGVPPENVFVGNGSDEVLATAFQAFYDESRPVLLPGVSYSFYPVYCNLYKIPYKEIDMNPDLTLNTAEFLRPGGVVLANPNAPTSLELGLTDLVKIIEAHPDDVVTIDEAYAEFGGVSALPLIPEYENLLV